MNNAPIQLRNLKYRESCLDCNDISRALLQVFVIILVGESRGPQSWDRRQDKHGIGLTLQKTREEKAVGLKEYCPHGAVRTQWSE